MRVDEGDKTTDRNKEKEKRQKFAKLTAIVESLLWLLLLPFKRGLRATTR